MSSSLFHASFAFAASAPFLMVFGLAPELAFVAVLFSVLMDLDASISPSPKHEKAFHSPTAVLITFMLPVLASVLSIDASIAALPAVAICSHIFQDAISGEIDLGDGVAAFIFMPRLSRALDMASFPIAFIFMLV